MQSIFFFLLFLRLFCQPSLAIEEFTLEQNITYTINHSGSAHVKQENKLTNNFSQIYSPEYVYQLSDTGVQNIVGSDSAGNIVKSVEKNDDGTTVSLKFNDPAVGKGNSTVFSLSFQSPDFAVNKGKMWEIALPEFINHKESDIINLTLKVPLSFGKISFSSVPLASTSQSGQNHLIQINSSSVKDQKILLIFGDFQLFDFNLTYYLDNDNKDYISTQIAIPPDTENQKIYYSSIQPQPQNIVQDNDGNWLAEYFLDPLETVEVHVTGQVKISPLSATQEEIDFQSLTKDQEFWPVSDDQIQAIANSLSTPKDIYSYVVKTLNYDYNQINSAKRKGALMALAQPDNSLCTEFTDLFVTLARAKGIPAREIEGYAHTNNTKIKPTNVNADILHAWPQYYDNASKKWKSIDPTWGKTTKGIDYFNDLDLNHFTLVIHGEDSQNPPPPGSYKKNRQTKTVDIKFAQSELEKPNISPIVLEPISTKINQSPKIKISNPNLLALTNITIKGIGFEYKQQLPSLPPLGSVEAEIPQIPFFKSLLPHNQKIKLLVSHIDSPSVEEIEIRYLPHFLNLAITLLGTVFILSTIALVVNIAKRKQT
ncbi:MAG: transglutaminase-like domain-containing protein [Patescibacteria group bacterium]|jgi:transglutaminase-like putative cysteine protease